MKFSQYCLAVENNENGITVFNTRYSKWVKISNKEDINKFKNLFDLHKDLPENDSMVQKFYENGYVVDDNINEYEDMKTQINNYLNEEKKHFELVIFTTRQCNFRCIYCPEKHINESLSEDKWNALYKYIEKSLNNGLYETITLYFFGGEPLLEIKQILKFLERLKKLTLKYTNVTCSHAIITNGYLLTPNIYNKLVSYDVKTFQVTVDGFAETHNKMRLMANGKDSWNKIIKNLKYINTVNDGAIIDYRVNYNDLNIKTLPSYKQFVNETFDNTKFRFTFYPVSKFTENVSDDLVADLQKEENIKKIEQITDMYDKRDYRYGAHPLRYFSYICKAAKPSTYTLNTDGKLSKCENIMSPSNIQFIGYLNDEGDFVYTCDTSIWEENFEIELCKECGMYPVCCARICPVKKICFPNERPDCIANDDNAMQNIIKFVKQL